MYIYLNDLVRQFYAMSSNGLVHAMLWLVVFDIATGFMKAYKNDCLNSTIARKGILSHVLIMIIVLIVTPYLQLLGFQLISQGVLLFYIGSYGISLVENLTEMGAPIPPIIIEKLEKLKGRVK